MNLSRSLENQLLEKANDLIGQIAGSQGGHADLVQALIQLINLRDRVPSTQKWGVFKSNYLKQQILDASISLGLEKLVSAAEDGDDLRPWLHDAIFIDKQDALMNDWGIQHYHLGLSLESRASGRNKISRTGDLLYAMHKEHTAKLYMIGVFDHGSFSEKQLLEIVNADWPDLLGHAKIENLIDISHSPSSPEIHQLRKNQINSAVEIDGEFFMGPGGGYTMSGHSTTAVMKALGIKRMLCQIQKAVDDGEISVRFVVQNRWVVLVDETNNRHCQIL